jgi:hypothetical protein
LGELVLGNLAKEPKASPRDRSQPRLVATAVANRPARRADSTGQGRLGHGASTPHRVEQFRLVDHAVAMGDQMDEQVEHLRFDVARRAAPQQFSAGDIDLAIAKGEDHDQPLRLAEAKVAKIKPI